MHMSWPRAAGNFCPPRRALVTEGGSSRVRNDNLRQSYTEPLLMRPSAAPLICWAEAGRRPCRVSAATPLTSPRGVQEATGVRDFYGCRRMNKNPRQSCTEPLLMSPSAPLICWPEAGRRPCRDPAATPLTRPRGVQEATGGFPRAKSSPFVSPHICARQVAPCVRYGPRV